MCACPFGDELASPLSECPDPADRATLLRHAQACPSCRDSLARLTASRDTERWRPAGPAPVGDRPGPAPAGASRPSWPAVPGYEILGELGRGGMGVVFHARQLILGRTVALKTLLAGPRAGTAERARLRFEAAALARVRHPNVVHIFDAGEAAGEAYLVLELVAGGSLAGYADGRPQPARASAGLVEVLARAVHAVHAAGVVHRDLKPANVLLERPRVPRADGSPGGPADEPFPVPKLADFGLAKLADPGEAPVWPGHTPTGEVFGTPGYMAPEQSVAPDEPVGPAADIYALGAVLYELLTGRPPFHGGSPLVTALQAAHDDPVPVRERRPDAPPDLEAVCLKCLRKRPEERYPTAGSLADDLARFLRGQPTHARPRTPLGRLWNWVRGRPRGNAH